MPRPASSDAIPPSSKPHGYFSHLRHEVLGVLPRTAESVLDIGCGRGVSGAYLKATGVRRVVGLEIEPEAAEEARLHLDAVLQIDIGADELDIEETFDVLLFADVLEHTPNPGEILRKFLPCLRESGVVVISVPNVRHHSVVAPLLLRGQWTYADEGILDRTHLHFFTRASLRQMICDAHLRVDRLEPLPRASMRAKMFHAATGGIFREFFTTQHLAVASRPPGK